MNLSLRGADFRDVSQSKSIAVTAAATRLNEDAKPFNVKSEDKIGGARNA